MKTIINSTLARLIGGIALSATILTSCERMATGGETRRKSSQPLPRPRLDFRTRISEAFVPYDPAHGIFGFFRVLDHQAYDTWLWSGTQRLARAKAYESDMHGMYGFMIYITDPDADITAFDIDQSGQLRHIRLITMEVRDGHKVVYINTATSRIEYHRILIVITSPHPERRFYFSLFGDPDSGFD